MKSQIRLSVLFILLSLQLLFIHCQYPINMSANYKYAYSYVIDINSQIIAANSTDWDNSPQFTVAYPKSLTATDVLIDPIISDISFSNILQGISARAYIQDYNGTVMTFNLYTNKASSIQKITIAYLIMYNNVAFAGNFAAYKYNFTVNQNISQSTPFLGSIVLPTIINSTGGVNSFGVIAGLNIKPTNPVGIIGVISNFAVLSQSQLGLSISSLTNYTTYVKQMAYVIIIYNQGYFNQSTICNAFNGFVQQTDVNSLSYSNQALQMQLFNTFVGLTSFQVFNKNSLQFFVTLESPHYFWTNSSQSFSYFSVSYFVFLCNYCDFRTPYLFTQNNLCYLSCPALYLPNELTLQCSPCSSNCTLSTAQISSQGSIPVYAIILISVFGVSITVVITIVIYFKCAKKKRQAQYLQQNKVSNIRKVIQFKRPENEVNPEPPQQINQSNKPIFYGLPKQVKDNHSKVNLTQQNEQERVQIIQQQWRRADQNLQFQHSCFCSKERPYLRCTCSHNFHLTCLLDWLLKQKEERLCPLCRKQIPTKAEFYCNKCRQYYKIIDLDFYNQDRERLSKLSINCKECPI